MVFFFLLVFSTFSFAQQYVNIKPSPGTQIYWSQSSSIGLIGFWLLNEGSGNVVSDLSGSGSDGTLTNMTPLTAWIPGKDGYALEFDGTNDRIVIPAVGVTTTFSFSVWIKPSSQTESYGNVGGSADAFDNIFYRGSGAGGSAGLLNFWHDGADHHNNTPLIDNVWSHYVVSANAGSYTHYLNGVPDGTGSANDAFNWEIFGDDDLDETFKGALSDIRIYNRYLTPEEIWSLYVYSYAIFEKPLYGRMLAAAAVAAAVERRRFIITND